VSPLQKQAQKEKNLRTRKQSNPKEKQERVQQIKVDTQIHTIGTDSLT